MRRFVSLFVTVFALCALEAYAGDQPKPLVIPDNFFMAYVKPDNTVAFGFSVPPDANPNFAEADASWWNVVAKHRVLMDTNADYKAAYFATASDPDLQSTGITFKAWSTASQDEKATLRATLRQRVADVLQKHGLRDQLASLQADNQQVALMAMQLSGAKRTALPLVRFCPGAEGNISVNHNDPDFPKLEQAMKTPRYDEALVAFKNFEAEHPNASIDDRTAKLNELVRPLLTASQ